MIIESDDCGPFHVRGTSSTESDGWDIQVWLKGSDQDEPEDHRFKVVRRQVVDFGIDGRERKAVLALIDQWEERLPLMLAAPLEPPERR